MVRGSKQGSRVPKGASINPADFTDDQPKPLDNTKAERKRISGMSLDVVRCSFLPPPADPKSYFDMRGVPCAWAECWERVSSPHTFLHLLCIGSHDSKLKELYQVRTDAKKLLNGSPMGLSWLRNRPKFYFTGLDLESNRTRVRAWDWDMLRALDNLAKTRGFTERAIVISFGAKSLLTSPYASDGWDFFLKEIVHQWDEYLDQEITKIRREFSLKQS